MADENGIDTPLVESQDVVSPGSNSSTVENFDRAALESKVSAAFSKLNQLDPEPSLDAPADAPEAEPEASANEVDPPADAADDDAADEADADDEGNQQPEKPAKASGPTVPAAYRRSLEAYGWTPEEIDAAASANPAQFLVTAQKIHTNRAAEIAKWAEIGRQTKTAAPEAPAKGASKSTGKQGLPVLDVDGLVEKYGNEQLVREIATPVQAVIETLQQLMPDLMTGVDAIRQSRQQSLSTQVEQFFGSEELKTYNEIYGADSKAMTDAQKQHRNKVLELADNLVAGAEQNGTTLSVTEALRLAHDSASSSYKVQVVRAGIKKDLKQRQAGLSVRPSKGGQTPNTGAPKDKSELENRTRNRLANVFGS